MTNIWSGAYIAALCMSHTSFASNAIILTIKRFSQSHIGFQGLIKQCHGQGECIELPLTSCSTTYTAISGMRLPFNSALTHRASNHSCVSQSLCLHSIHTELEWLYVCIYVWLQNTTVYYSPSFICYCTPLPPPPLVSGMCVCVCVYCFMRFLRVCIAIFVTDLLLQRYHLNCFFLYTTLHTF